MTSIIVTTANICGNPLRPRRVVRRRMRKALARGGVTFGQECAGSNNFRIGRGDYATLWRDTARSFGKRTYGYPREVPISAGSRYEIESFSSRKLHGGKAGVSPARYVTIVRGSKDGFKVAFIDGHPPSKPRWGVPFSRWRIEHWNLYLTKLAEIVAELAAGGHTVVFGGDMNKSLRAMPEIHPRQQLLISSGLDHLWVVPAEGVGVRVTRRTKIRRTVLMDHPILSVSFDLEKK